MRVFTSLTLWVLFSLITCRIENSDAAKILAIFPFTGRSQYICAENYLKALAARGHDVTVISAFPQKKPIQNFTDVPLIYEKDIFEEYIVDADFPALSKWEDLNFGISYLQPSTEKVLEHPVLQKWLQNGDTFDLMIVEVLQQESLYALAYHFKASLIGVSSYGTDMRIDELVGNTSPLSYIPTTTSKLTDHMNFRERLENFYEHVLEWLHNRFVMLPLQYELYKKYVPNPVAPFMEMRDNFSLVLLNQHFSLSFPRPYVPNAIEVGGFHIDYKPRKLPADMAEFINAAPKGVIYFSLGTNIRSKNLSAKRRAILMEVFASLKDYHILWKFEEPELPGKPANVFISKWFPQPDVLAHPKVKLFITHGGLLSTIEAIHHAKPVVGMPVFYDQHLNIVRARQKGLGVSVDFKHFTANQLKSAILEVLENPKYAKRAKEISQLYHDQPEKPVQRAIYWTEYVLRHKGAPHMRVAARDLNFVEYHNLDVMAVLFGGPLLALLIATWLSCRILKAFVGRGTEQKKKVKRS